MHTNLYHVMTKTKNTALLTNAQVVEAFSAMRDFRILFGTFPRGEEFTVELLLPEDSDGVIDEESVSSIRVNVKGSSINTDASIYKFAYLMLDADSKVKITPKTIKHGTEVVETAADLRAHGVQTVADWVKRCVALDPKFDLTKVKFRVTGQVPMLNLHSANMGDKLLSSKCYTGYTAFQTKTAKPDWDSEEFRTMYYMERDILHSTPVKEGIKMEDSSNWITNPVLSIIKTA